MLFSTIPTLAHIITLVPQAAQRGITGHPSQTLSLGCSLGTSEHQTEANPKTTSPHHTLMTSKQGPGNVSTEKTPIKIIRKQRGHKVPTPRGRRCLQTALPALMLPSSSILRAFPSGVAKTPSQNGQQGGRVAGG